MAYSIGSYFSESITQGSDEVQEMFCEHCNKHVNKYATADGFCEECLEYMCGTCIMYHKRYMGSHTIKDKDSMPQDFCLVKCSTHQDELIKFYCQGCKKFACPECKNQDHGNCNMVRHLPTLVREIENSDKIRELVDNFEELLKNLENIEMHVIKNMKMVTSQETNIKDKITETKKEILSVFEKHKKETIENFERKIEETLKRLKNEKQKMIEKLQKNKKSLEKLLDKEETEIKMKIETIKHDDQKILETIKGETCTMKNNIKTLSTEIIHHKNAEQRCQLFISMIMAKTIIEQLRTDVTKQCENNIIHFYNVKCKAFKHNITNIQDSDKIFTFQDMHKSEVERTAHLYLNINYDCGINPCLCLISENCLLITDNNSNSLIIFKDLTVSTSTYNSIDLPSKPCAVVKVDSNKAAVTLPDLGEIRLITFSKSMILTNTEDIIVGKCCHGVAYSKNQLVVSYVTKPATVKILDMSGKVLKTISKDHNGRCLFDSPWFLTVSVDNTVIYVSDSMENSVLCLTFDGKVKAIYKDDQLRGPNQVIVDRSGAVFVCGNWSRNVHQLSSDLNKVKILLDEGQGISNPRGMAYCQNNNRLYVGQRFGNFKVFDLSLF